MVSKRQPPYIKKLVEDKLSKYFKAIVQVYEPLKGIKRNSFLNYYYVLYKLCVKHAAEGRSHCSSRD
jgi:hypothetical protein